MSPEEQAAWRAALGPGETLSEFLRAAAAAERRRRVQEAALRERGSAAAPALDALDAILERARGAVQ